MPKQLGQSGPNVPKDPTVCYTCWQVWKANGRRPSTRPRPLTRHDTWQLRVDCRNLGDQSTRLGGVQVLGIFCREHGQDIMHRLSGVEPDAVAVQEALL